MNQIQMNEYNVNKITESDILFLKISSTSFPILRTGNADLQL